MADYSHVPLTKKLGMKEGMSLLFLHAPEGFQETLSLPLETEIYTELDSVADIVLLFAVNQEALMEPFPLLVQNLPANGSLWAAYPKKASKVPTDLTFEVVQGVGLSAGLVDNKVCSIDEIWTAVRFVYRVKDRLKVRV